MKLTEEELGKAAVEFLNKCRGSEWLASDAVKPSWVMQYTDFFIAGAKWALEQMEEKYLDGFEQGVKSVWEAKEQDEN